MAFQYIYLSLAGLLISLTGSLPLGVLNVATMQIAAKETSLNAIRFAIGATLVEMAYLALTLIFIGRLPNYPQLLFVFSVSSVILLLFMAAGNFMAIYSKQKKNIVLDNSMNRLFLGASMSLVNPLQVPFWMGWSLYLVSQSFPLNSPAGNIIFTLSAGAGTFVAFLLFIFVGKKYSGKITGNSTLVNVLIGSLLTILAAIQAVKLLL